MIPKKHRLPTSSFPLQGYRFVSKYFSCVYRPNSSLPRIAVVVSKKISLKAVGRNLLRRRFQASLLPLLPIIQPHDVVIYPQKTSHSLDFPTLSSELKVTLKKTGLIHA